MADDVAAPVDDEGEHVACCAQQTGKSRHLLQIEFANEYSERGRITGALSGDDERDRQRYHDISARRQVGVRPDFSVFKTCA